MRRAHAPVQRRSFELLPGRPHGWDLLAGKSPEGLGNKVRVGGHHLLPASGFHHVRHVPRVDELNGLNDGIRFTSKFALGQLSFIVSYIKIGRN